MYKEILDALKAKFEGVSETILGRVAKNLAKTTTTAEEVETAVSGVTFQQVLESYGDSRATEAADTVRKKYAKQQQDDEPKPQPQDDTKEDMPQWAQELMKAVSAVSGTVAEMKGARLTDSRKAMLDKILEPLSATQRKAYGRIRLDSMEEEEFTTMLDEVKEEVETMAKEQQARGAVFGRPRKAGAVTDQGKEASDTEVEEVLSHLNV